MKMIPINFLTVFMFISTSHCEVYGDTNGTSLSGILGEYDYEYDNYTTIFSSNPPTPKKTKFNEERTVNKVHEHNSALLKLFEFNEKFVLTSIYRVLYEDTYLSLVRVERTIEKALEAANATQLDSSEEEEIHQIFTTIDTRKKEIYDASSYRWLLDNIIHHSQNISEVLSATTILQRLNDLLVENVRRRAWRCEKNDILVELWEDIVSSRSSCLCATEEKNGCCEVTKEKRKQAIEGLVHVSQAIANSTDISGVFIDYGGNTAKTKIRLLSTLSQQGNLRFLKNTLGGRAKLRELVKKILCRQSLEPLVKRIPSSRILDILIVCVRLELVETVLSDITKAGQPFAYLYNTSADQFVSTSDDIVSLIRIQESIGKIIDDIAKNLPGAANKEGLGHYKLGKSILNTYMNLVENIVNSNSSDAWAQMPYSEVEERMRNMLLTTDRYVGTISDIILNPSFKNSAKNLTFDKDSLSVSLSLVSSRKNTSTAAQFVFDDVAIVVDEFWSSDDGELNVYTIRYKSWSSLIRNISLKNLHPNISKYSKRARSLDNAVLRTDSVKKCNKTFVGEGGVISLSARKNGIKESVPVTYWIKFANHSSSERQCLSCEFLNPSTLKWESRGCYVVSVDRFGITCKCNHTTNFAAFMMPVEMEFTTSSGVKEVFRGISIVGSAMSIIGLICSLIIFFLVRNQVRNERLKAHCHLSISLLLVHVLYLLSDSFIQYDKVCVVLTVLTHFFMLVFFMWMLVEGIFLYLYVVQVFLHSSIVSYRWMYVVGWGIPVAIVIVAAGYGIPNNSYVMLAKHNDSDSQTFITCPNNTLMYPVLEQPSSRFAKDIYERCWLSTTSGMIWSFLAPALFVLAFNSVVMCKTLQVYIKSFNSSTPTARIPGKIFYNSHNPRNLLPIVPTGPGIPDVTLDRFSTSDTYDHLHGDTTSEQEPFTKSSVNMTGEKSISVESTSKGLLQVTTDNEADDPYTSALSSDHLLTTHLENSNTSSRTCRNSTSTNDNTLELHSGNEKQSDMRQSCSRYPSISESSRFSSTRPSVVYRNSVTLNSRKSSAAIFIRGPIENASATERRNFFRDTRAAVKGAFVLLPVLGIPWVCGVLSHLSPVLVFIFVALNSAQGFAIFVVYCFCNGEVRRALQRRLAVRRVQQRVDNSVRRSSSSSSPPSRRFILFGRRRSTITTTA